VGIGDLLDVSVVLSFALKLDLKHFSCSDLFFFGVNMRLNLASEGYTSAMESIEFQSYTVFNELCAAVKACREKGRNGQKIKEYYESGAPRLIAEVIEKSFGFKKINLFDGAPTAFLPLINRNHIFLSPFAKEASVDPDIDFDASSDMSRLLNRDKKEMAYGSVDIRTAKLTGAFLEIPCVMLLPLDELLGKKTPSALTDEEFTSIILHEVGHLFTTFEYVDRTIKTNQILHAMIAAQNSKVPPDQRKVVFTKFGQKINMSEKDIEDALVIKDKTALGVVVVNASIDHSKSELGESVYDTTSCEALADQFAMRMGCRSYLASGLDKILSYYGMRSAGSVGRFFANAVAFVSLICATVVTYGILLIILIACTTREDDYDRPRSRFTRMKLQLVEALKQDDLDSEMKTELTKEIENVEGILKLYDDNDGLIEKMALFFKSSLRKEKKMELFQKDLELLAGNDLFIKSAKLSTM